MVAIEVKDNTLKKKEERTGTQICAIIISTIAGITNGLLLAWGSPFVVQISQDKENYDITEEECSYFNTIPPLAMCLGAPIFSKLLNVIGRKKTLLLVVIPQIGSWLCAALAKSAYIFYLSRIFSGLADSCFFAALPIYVGEISSPRVRETWGNLVASSYYVGEFLINVIGSQFDVRGSSYVCLPLPIIFFVLFSFMPETPYYYLMKEDEENAKKSLRFLKRTNNIENDFIQLKADVKRQISESASWFDLMKIESNRKALTAGLFLRASQQFSGLVIFCTYTQFIFQKSGGNFSHEISSMLYTGLQMTLNMIVLLFVAKRFGRKPSFLISMVTTSIILYIMGTYYYLETNPNIDLSSFTWFPITSMIAYQISVSAGLAYIPTLMLSELYSVSIKAKAMIITVIGFGLVNFIVSYIYYYVNLWFGFFAPFYLFAVSVTVGAGLSYFIVPETRGKTLEEIQQSLKKRRSIF